MRIRIRALGWCVSPLLSVSLAAAGGDLRLVEAVQNKDAAAARSLLTQGIDVNTPQGDGATALAWAAHWNDLETADLLIRAGANVNSVNDLGVTPLWEACTNASAAMVEKLMRAGANPNTVMPNTGETVLMTCAGAGSADAVKLLLERGADVNAKEPQKGQTALMWALEERHPAAALVLIENGADIHAKSKGGFTPFLFAARRGDISSAKLLLQKGVDVNESWTSQTTRGGGGYGNAAAPERVGLSALLLAMDAGHEEFAVFLVENGANVNTTDADGYAPLHYAIRKGISLLRLVSVQNINGYRQPFSYLMRPAMSKLIRVLLERGANPNARIVKGSKKMAKLDGSDWTQVGLAGATPFLLAAAEGNVEIMRALISKGADPTIATNDGVTPLMAAAGVGRNGKDERTKAEEKQYVDAIKLLIELGADVNKGNDDGYTALHAAAYTASHEVLQLLVEKGANLDAKDVYGQTPLSIAEGDPNRLMDDHEIVYHPDTAELIRKLGAEPLPEPGRRLSYAELKKGNDAAGANEKSGAP